MAAHEERVAIVTGGSRGIGRAVAGRLARDGLRVVVGARGAADAEKAAAQIAESGGQALAVPADVTEPGAAARLFDAAEAAYGRVDVWVNNAAPATAGPLAHTTDEDFARYFTAAAYGTFTALREAARRIRDGGRIVLVSSALTVAPLPGTALLAAAKAAGDQLARTLAWELGPRAVTVNSVLPGLTRTDVLATVPPPVVEDALRRTPLGRLGEPDDIADAVGFLVSDAGRWVTAQTLHTAGGMI
ncbi:SDR family oxidoreductase [Streptomyces sp. NPDC021020]|uniref:SDR family oxidoreductase n=1 Tax=Streptomyces sp. NPDC021020 TaxID=3365109 RepID=UPI003796C4B6